MSQGEFFGGVFISLDGISIVSYNVMNEYPQSIGVKSNEEIDRRYIRVAKEIEFYNADVVCLQVLLIIGFLWYFRSCLF